MSLRALACATVAAAMGAGCVTVSAPRSPPEVATSTVRADTVPVYVTDYGVHSAIVLPVPGAAPPRFVEYAFGDFNYAALDHCAPWDAVGALLVSFGSGFGRIYFDADPATGDPVLHRRPVEVRRLEAPRDRVAALVARLDARYAAGRGPAVVNPDTGMSWVRDRAHYSWANNCNHQTIAALRALGFEARGVTAHASYRWRTGRAVDPVAVMPRIPRAAKADSGASARVE